MKIKQKCSQEGENHVKVGSQKSIEKYKKSLKLWPRWVKIVQKSDLGAILEPSGPHEGVRHPKSSENLDFSPPWPPKLEAKIQEKSWKRRSETSCFLVAFFGTVFLATWRQLGVRLVPQTYPKWGQVGSQEASNKQTGRISKMCTAPRREHDFEWFQGPKLAPNSIKNR